MKSIIPVFHPSTGTPEDLWIATGIPTRGLSLHKAIEVGFASRVYARLAGLIGLSESDMAKAMEIAPSTLHRRIKCGRFNRDESDKLYRLARIFSAACDLCEGDSSAARRWIAQPVKGLGGKQPIMMVETSAKTDEVLELIGRLEHGVLA